MRRFALPALLTLNLSWICSFAAATDKPVPVKDAAAKMTAPKGFEVSLFAGEPAVVQPIAFTFDDRGRMLVVECLSYPKWSRDGKGHDRVILLEDTDGDGVHDKKTVLIDNGVNLSGIEWGFGGVWLCSSPNLVFVPIENDKAGKPEVVLDGWNMTDTKHNVYNSLIWGPDGYLYGCNGIQSKSYIGAPGTPKDKRVYLDCGVWKYHPTKKQFEVVATGTTNPWGLDFDEHGEMFITNCVIDHLFHFVPGGRYQRMYGQDSNPFAFGLMSSCVDYKHWAGGPWNESRANLKTGELKKEHDDAGGGHAHSGCAIYLGDQFPAEYRNTLFTANIHGSRLNNDGLARTPTGMKGIRRPDFLFANDPWFRGICVKQGPEGALYVSDWCDTGECHNYDVADISNGRIYRVSYGKPKPFTGDVSKMTDQQLWDLQSSKNEWLVRKARRVLQERHARGQSLQITGLRSFKFENPLSEETLLRQHWVRRVLDVAVDPVQAEQSFAVRLDIARTHDASLQKLYAKSLVNDVSPVIRAAVLDKLGYLPPAETWELATKALSHSGDNANANLCQYYWLQIQPLVLQQPDAALGIVGKIAIHKVRENIVRLVMILPGSNLTQQIAKVLKTIEAAPEETHADLLQGLLLAFEDRKSVEKPTNWGPAFDKLSVSKNLSVVNLTMDLALKFGDERAVTRLKATMADASAPANVRIQAMEKLLPYRSTDLETSLLSWLADPGVRAAAIRGLATFPDERASTAILDLYPKLTAAEKADAIQTLASRARFASALLGKVEAGAIPKSDITAFTARQIAAIKDKAIGDQLKRVWGEVKPASANRKEQMARYKELLSPEKLKTANTERGRQLFTQNCATCHKLFGQGESVGPELTGSQRSNLEYVLENVLDPSAVVANEYKMTAFYLVDGRLVTGIIKKETANAITVRTVNAEVVIPVADIESRKATVNSVMPEGLLDAMKPADVIDLVAYLQTK